jgi:hypothetical protein
MHNMFSQFNVFSTFSAAGNGTGRRNARMNVLPRSSWDCQWHGSELSCSAVSCSRICLLILIILK